MISTATIVTRAPCLNRALTGVMTASMHRVARLLTIAQSALADFSANELEHPIASDSTKMSRIHGFYW